MTKINQKYSKIDFLLLLTNRLSLILQVKSKQNQHVEQRINVTKI